MSDLLLDLEHHARTEAFALEMQGKLPPRFTEQHYPLNAHEARELRRLNNCGALATDVDSYVALCKGAPVHPSRLAPEVVRLWRRP